MPNDISWFRECIDGRISMQHDDGAFDLSSCVGRNREELPIRPAACIEDPMERVMSQDEPADDRLSHASCLIAAVR
jgi:hypothetical protein